MTYSRLTINLFIVLIGAMLFIPGLGSVHLFDWDEINFAECAREMVVTGNYSQVMINYQPFWEKPPLFFWLQAISMNVFGINEFAARLPNAVCGIITLLTLFNIGARHFNQKFGLMWVLVYAGSFLPHFYFKSGIIDPFFNLFIFLGIYFFTVYSSCYTNPYEKRNPIMWLLFSAIFIGLAILTKGPVALLIFGLCFIVFWIVKKFKMFFGIKDILLWAFVVLLTGSSWFIIEILRGRFDIIVEFFEYQVRLFQIKDAGHGGPFFYHFLILLLGCFPASVFAIKAHWKIPGLRIYEKFLKNWMIILLWVVLILFSIVKTKIVHYSSLAYFPLTFLATWAIHYLAQHKLKHKSWMSFLIVVIGSLLGIAILLVPIIGRNTQKFLQLINIKDQFAVENLNANVNWTGYESLLGVFLLVAVVVYLVMIKKKNVFNAYLTILLASLFTINVTALLFIPKIERYSQGASIDFYKSLANKDVYAEPLFFKSYAHLFYTNRRPPTDPRSNDINWILKGEDVDKPVYAVARINRVEDVAYYYPQLVELYRKNGFVFYKRKMSQPGIGK